MGISADRTPAVSPLAKAHAMEGVRTGDGDEPSDGRIHSFQANRTSRELVGTGSVGGRETGDGGGTRVLSVDCYGQDADNMAYLGLNTRKRVQKC